VERLTPSKTEEKPTSSICVRIAGYVEALATPGVMAHCRKEEKIRKPLDDGDTSGTLVVSCSGRAALRREQWECSENEHHEKRKEQLGKTLKAWPPERKER
jgi:hypothetical protein